MKTTAVITSISCAVALPMCADFEAPSATAFRPGPAPACEEIPPECLPEPPAEPPACGDCEGGVVELTLRYTGGVAASIEIEAGDDLYDLGIVAPAGEFTIAGTRADGRFDGNNLEIEIGGVEQDQAIHVSCSQPIGPGLAFGMLEVVAAVSRENGPVCPAPDCLWCGVADDKAKGVSFLAFRYTGAGAIVTVHNGNKLSAAELFGGPLVSGDLVELRASDIGKDKLKSSISFFDDTEDLLLDIHTSCSQPLVPGSVYATAVGDFELMAGADKNDTALCPLLPQCEECGFGEHDAAGVHEVELVYSGPAQHLAFTSFGNPAALFVGDVVDGDIIVLSAAAVGDLALGGFVNVFSTHAWDWVGNFGSDCSAPLGPGVVIGMPGFQLTVSGGVALGGGGLCLYDPV